MKKLLCLTLCALLLFSSCETVNKSAVIYYISSEPVTLDPQSVTDEGGKTVVMNTFMGLMQCFNGNVETAAAESYTEYGNRIEFTLKNDLKWQNGEAVTADDFVFGFQRLLTSETGSTEATRFFFLRGAKEYYNKETSVFSSVKNEDGKVVFYLDYIPNNFYEMLSYPGTMPCNREFFYETKGRYGLEAKSILTNGAMYVASWIHDGSIGLRKNTNYIYSKAVPQSLSIFINSSEEDIIGEFADGKSDVLMLQYKPDDLKESKYTVNEYTAYYGGLIFNHDGPFGEYNLRKAFALTVDKDSYSGSLFGGMTSDDSFVFNSSREYNAADGYAALNCVSTETGNIRFIVPEGGYKDVLSYQTQIWQRDLDIYFGITELSNDEYETALKNGDFDIAFVSIPFGSSDGGEELQTFLSYGSENYGKYNNPQFDNAENSYLNGLSLPDSAKKIIYDDMVFIPILKSQRYVYMQKGIKNAFYIQELGVMYFGNVRE